MVSKQQRVAVIEQAPLFSQLTPEECQKLAPVFKERTVSDGEVLCEEGSTEDYMAVVVEGELIIQVRGSGGEQTIVSRRKRGEVVGEMACLDPSARSATVRAEGPATVLVLSRTMLDSLKTNSPGLFSRVVRGIAYRLAEMLDDTNALISELLNISKPPAQVDQPDMATLHRRASSGTLFDPVEEDMELPATGSLQRLGENEREALRLFTQGRRYESGDVICVEGEPAKEAYFLIDGEIEVLRAIQGKNYRMAMIAEGGILGQRALLREGKRSASLRSGPDGTTVFALSRKRFDALLAAESQLAVGFQEAVTISGIRQLRRANDVAAYLGARPQRQQLPMDGQQPVDGGDESGDSVEERIRTLAEDSGAESEDVESLANAYLQTALEDWDVTPSELSNIEVVEVDDDES